MVSVVWREFGGWLSSDERSQNQGSEGGKKSIKSALIEQQQADRRQQHCILSPRAHLDLSLDYSLNKLCLGRKKTCQNDQQTPIQRRG